MHSILASTNKPVPPATPVKDALCLLNDVGEKFISVRSTVTTPLSHGISRLMALGINGLPAVATTLNHWVGKDVISPRQIQLWQAFLKYPNKPLDAALKNYLEPCFALLARYLLEQPTMMLLGGRSDPRGEFLHLAKANDILDTPVNRERLKQLYCVAIAEEPTLESETRRFLSLMIIIAGSGGGEVKPRQLNAEMFEDLFEALWLGGALNWEKNTSNKAEAQRWTRAELKTKVKSFLTAKFAEQCAAQYVNSEMLVQLSGVPAQLQSQLLAKVWPTTAAPTATPASAPTVSAPPAPPPGIHFPYVGTLRTLSPAGQDVVLATNSSMVLNAAACPAQLPLNATSPARGISIGGVGKHTMEDMELYLANNNTAPTPVYLKSRYPATQYSTTLVTSPLRAITHLSADTKVAVDQPATAFANEVCSLQEPAIPAPALTVPQLLPAQPPAWTDLVQRFDTMFTGMLTLPGVGAAQSEPYRSLSKRDVNTERKPGDTPQNPVQYDRLPDVAPVVSTAAPSPVQPKVALDACKLWRQVVNHAPLAEIEAGCTRYLALRDEHVALREIGKDYHFQEETVPSHANSLKTVQQTLENIITRRDNDSPFSLNMDEFAFFLNDQRTGWDHGLAIMSGGEARASLRMFGKMMLPLLERTLKDITTPPLFAGFAALNRNIIADLTDAAIDSLTVEAFALRVADKTRQFCDELGRQYPQLSSLDIARIRLLLEEQNKEAFPVIEFASHPEIRQMSAFSEQGIWAALAATVVAEKKYRTIPLKIVKRIGLHLLLNQSTDTLVTMLGWTTRVSVGVKENLKKWWQREGQTFTDVWEFTRAQRALDKLLLEPQDVTPAQLNKAKAEQHAALRQFYKNALLDLPQSAVKGLEKNYPNAVTVTFVQISPPGDPSPGKPTLGVIFQYAGKAYLITPLAKIGDPPRRAVFDVSDMIEGSGFRTPQQEKKLSDMLFENAAALPRHQLTFTTKHLFFHRDTGLLWNDNLAETVVTQIEKLANPPADLPASTSTTPAAEGGIFGFFYSHAKSLIYNSPWGSCLDVLDNLLNPAKETFLEQAGTGAMCIEELIPETEAASELFKAGESIVKQGLKWVKNHAAAQRQVAQPQNPDGEQQRAITQWEEQEFGDFMDFSANLENLYDHRELKPWLAPLQQPTWAPLSTATFRPAMTSEETLNELVGYDNYGAEEEGKEYLKYKYGDTEVQFEVIAYSLSADGEVLYELPAGAPSDRIVMVKKDQQGHLQVVGTQQIKIMPVSEGASVPVAGGGCGLSVPEGMTVEEVYISTFNDHRLVLKVKDKDGSIYWREVDAEGNFVPFEPGIFAHVRERSRRSIDDDPVSDATPLYIGKYGLARINDKVRRAELVGLAEARNSLLNLKPEKQLMVELIWEAGQLKKLPGHLTMQTYVNSLAHNDVTLPGYQALISVIDKIADGALTFITERIPATEPDYHVRLQVLADAARGLEDIIKIFALPGSDHTLTEADIEKYQTLANVVINAADVMPTKIFAFRKAYEGFTNRVRRYMRVFNKFIFKSARISDFFRTPLSVPEAYNGIKYVAEGEVIEDKFPFLDGQLRKIHNEKMLTIEKLEETVRQDSDFIAREVKKFFHIPDDVSADISVFEKIIKEYHRMAKKTKSENIKIFKDYNGVNPINQQNQRVAFLTAMERKIISVAAVEGQSTANDAKLRVGLNCGSEGNTPLVATIIEHEDLHHAILKHLPRGITIKGEAYLTWLKRPRTLLRTEQMELLNKMMSAPAVFRAYMEGQPEFIEPFFHACIFSTHDEISRLARELRQNWQSPLSAQNLAMVNKIIDIMYEQPEHKIQPWLHFPDGVLSIYRHLVKSIPAPIAASVEAEWESLE